MKTYNNKIVVLFLSVFVFFNTVKQATAFNIDKVLSLIKGRHNDSSNKYLGRDIPEMLVGLDSFKSSSVVDDKEYESLLGKHYSEEDAKRDAVLQNEQDEHDMFMSD
jgi:hypothetical protein